uniref:NAC domain-containing protein n=1 Tax=Ananas comosus var. bracteatus TaxID=296719 RepID=A0A6V7PFH7_ANACO|nr:unnamed protein product [Ananas comosus var. bracteatus]
MAQQCRPSPLGTAPRPRRSQSEESVALSFTFTPNDEQLIVHYLRAYAAGQNLRWDHVVEAEVYSTDPRSLLGDGGEIGYFLTKRTRHGNRVKRTAGGGTWTGQTRKNEIVSARGDVVGFKAMFSFCIGGGDDDCSTKPSKKTTGFVMYEYELPSTANKGVRRQGESQEPVLCCIKRSAREIARSRKRKREETLRAPAAETNIAASVRHPTQISEAGLEYDSTEFADSSTLTDEALALAGIPLRQFAADRSSAPPTYLSADTINLFSNSSTEMTIGVDQQQPIPYPYHGDELVTTNADDIFEVGECGYYSTAPEYADSITLTSGAPADVGTSSSTYAVDYSALGMAADVNLQPIPYHGLWTEMMNAGISYGLGGDTYTGDVVGSTAVEGAGDRQPPPLPYELTGMTTAAATADQQLLLAPDQDQQTVVDEAGSLDQLLSVLDEEGFSDWHDWVLDAEPSLPPLVDSGMPFRDCWMPPIPLSDSGIASSAAIEGNKHA